MAVSAYEVISTQTLGSAAASVTFSSIPQTYTDLVLITSSAGSADVDIFGRLNGDTGSNYSGTRVYGNGSVAASDRESSQTRMQLGVSRSAQTTNILQINNYSNTTTYKTVFNRSNEAGYSTIAWVCLWRSTAAISTVLLYPASGNFNTGSTFTLYGIKAA